MAKKMFIMVIAIITISTGLYYYNKDQSKKETKTAIKPSKPKTVAHQMPDNVEKELIKDLKKNIQTIQSVTTDTKALEQALSEEALISTRSSIENKLKQNIATRRNYEDIKLNISNYTSGIASVLLEFTDKSYNYSTVDGKELSKPTGAKTKLALSVKKVDKTWKIIGIYTATAVNKKAAGKKSAVKQPAGPAVQPENK